jgi:DNA polymerase-3 subunit beta
MGYNTKTLSAVMHTTISVTELREVLEKASRVSTKHVTLPVLQCVLLEATGDQLVVRATNLEIGVEAAINATTTESGTVAVPAQILMQTINLLTAREVTLQVEGGALLVGSAGSKTEIKCIPHEEFPSIPKLTEAGQTVNGKLFALGIKTAAFAASPSTIKPELGSVYVYQKREHTLTFVATDSFRLMEKTVPQKGVVFEQGVLIPHKNALEIARLLEGEDSDPICHLTENQCAFQFGNGLYVTTRLTTGSFPDYEQIIPKEYVTHTTLLKSDLAHAFKKSNIFLNRFLQVKLQVAAKTLTVSADNGDVGTTTEAIPVDTEGDELALNFNQRYVAEALPHFVDDSLTMHFAGIGRPMVMKGVSDQSVRYLVMPMNK